MPVVVLAVMSPFLRSYLTVVWFGLASFLVAGLLLGISALIRPNKPNPEKLLTYESGVETIGDTWVQFRAKYYLIGLIFLIFDVEVIFLFPIALAYSKLSLFAVVSAITFVLILLLGLFLEWRKGALEWN